MMALAAVAAASAKAVAQPTPASDESPWATCAPATPAPDTSHARINVIHTSQAAITPEHRALAEKFVQSVNAKDPVKMRALIPPTTLKCFDKSSAPFLDAWIANRFRYQIPNDYRLSITPIPPVMSKSSKLETYPVPGTHLLLFEYSVANNPVSVTQAIGIEDGNWYLTPPCPTAAGMDRFTKTEAIRAAGRERADRIYPQLRDPLKSQLLALIAKHKNANAMKLSMRTLHIDYITARALVAKLAANNPN
jgi:hypothetical protein